MKTGVFHWGNRIIWRLAAVGGMSFFIGETRFFRGEMSFGSKFSLGKPMLAEAFFIRRIFYRGAGMCINAGEGNKVKYGYSTVLCSILTT